MDQAQCQQVKVLFFLEGPTAAGSPIAVRSEIEDDFPPRPNTIPKLNDIEIRLSSPIRCFISR